MKKSLRAVLTFAVAMSFVSIAAAAAPLGTNPHPPMTPRPSTPAASFSDVISTVLSDFSL
jgi:hypothetical protein